MQTKSIVYSFLILIAIFIAPALKASEFPGRAVYPDVKTVEITELDTKFDQYVVIDTRSGYEFDTLHIKGAINVSISSENFARRVRDISNLTKKPLVFYCNGHDCMKSYKAARAAKLAGVTDSYAYDAGMLDWANKYPAKTALLGKPMKSTRQLIPVSRLNEHMLDSKKFATFAKNKDHFSTIDVRSRYQRAEVGLFPFVENWVPMEQTEVLKKAINEAVSADKTLLFYDEVGEQVRWLQYRLEEMGVRKYYFMKGGATAYIKTI